RLEADVEEGKRGAALAVNILEETNEYISTCQVGVTMCSIGLGALGIETVSRALENALDGPVGDTLAVIIALTVGYLVLTSAQVIIGELVPKIYAIDKSDELLRRVARPLRFWHVVLRPLSAIYY